MTELPMHLKRLEALPSALDMIRLLYSKPEHTADIDEICDTLDISDRRFRKVTRRLVTLGYMTMVEDYVYQLTQNGVSGGDELAEYDANAPQKEDESANKLARQLVIAMPRMFTSNQANDVFIGFAQTAQFNASTTVALRLNAIHADLSSSDEMIQLSADAQKIALKMTPESFDQLRLRVQIFQIAPDGENISDCGGMYIDADVSASAPSDGMVAYGATIYFDPE